MRILIVGHACCPGRGSEPGYTWNWAANLSAGHEVWVLTHPKFRVFVDEALLGNAYPGLHVRFVSVPRIIDPWRALDTDRFIRPHYLLWQHVAFREARRLHARFGFDVVHQVSWASVSAPPLLTRLSAPFVWGPVGGGQTANPAFRQYFGSGWTRERRRSLRVRNLRHLPSVRRTARDSSLVLVANRETYELLQEFGSKRMLLFPDCGIEPCLIPPSVPSRPLRETFVLHWSGRIEPRKALPLALHALAAVRDLPVRLIVSGDGPLRQEGERWAHQLGLAHVVTFTGFVSRPELIEMFRKSDAFLFTSLQDTFGSVVLEAMAQGLPVITLDHQGVGTHLPLEAAIKAPAYRPEETIARLADGIRLLVADRERARSMSKAAWLWAAKQTWDHRARQMSSWYDEVVAEWASPCAAALPERSY